jgi:hypothetical protein
MHYSLFELWLAWLAAHLLGDFVLQTDWMVAHKRRSAVLAGHAAVFGILSFALAGRFTVPGAEAAALIMVTHGIIDWIKLRSASKSAAGFVLDQLAHLAVIAALPFAFALHHIGSAWLSRFGPVWLAGLILLCGLILCVHVAGHLIGFAVQPYLDEILTAGGSGLDSPTRGLTRAGRTIGRWERALIFLFVLVGQPGGIGFLITAKSIFRFGELKDPSNRREAEYITIGTLMSFGVAIALAYGTVLLARSLSHWPRP